VRTTVGGALGASVRLGDAVGNGVLVARMVGCAVGLGADVAAMRCVGEGSGLAAIVGALVGACATCCCPGLSQCARPCPKNQPPMMTTTAAAMVIAQDVPLLPPLVRRGPLGVRRRRRCRSLLIARAAVAQCRRRAPAQVLSQSRAAPQSVRYTPL
jgi:hypothetical protein